MRVREELLDAEEMAAFVVDVLEAMDNEYWRDPEKKLGIIQLSTEFASEGLGDALVDFVDDHHEDVRYSAVEALAKIESDAGREEILTKLSGDESSKRIQVRLADHVIGRGWSLTDEERSALEGVLPDGYAIGKDGALRRG